MITSLCTVPFRAVGGKCAAVCHIEHATLKAQLVFFFGGLGDTCMQMWAESAVAPLVSHPLQRVWLDVLSRERTAEQADGCGAFCQSMD